MSLTFIYSAKVPYVAVCLAVDLGYLCFGNISKKLFS